MLNEEVSKEVLGQAARTVENEVVKPITHFVTEHFVKPTAEMLVDDLKKVATAPGKAIKNNTGGECDGIRWSRIVLRTGFRRICSGTGRKNTELCHNMCTYQRRGSGITLGLLVVFCQNG